MFKINLEHIGTVSTYDQVSASYLVACLVTVAIDPLVSREEFTCFHILLRVLFYVFDGRSLCVYICKSKRYHSDFRRCIALRIYTTRNQKKMRFVLDKILESRETSLVAVAVGIVANVDRVP
jgi:hypothetical protein